VAVTRETMLTAFEALGLRQTRPRRLLAERLAGLAASARDFSTDEPPWRVFAGSKGGQGDRYEVIFSWEKT
jgi:hypothetical protein